MKPIYVALVAGLLAGCSFPILATAPSGEVANIIYIETEDEPADAYKKFGRLLAQETYEIREASSDLRTLQTEPRTYERLFSMRLSVAVLENPTRVQLIGNLDGGRLGDMRVVAKGQSKSPQATAWREMERLARMYDGGEIAYGYRAP